MRYCFDIDGTICTNTEGDYNNAKPYLKRIAVINRLYDEGHFIFFLTARGSTTGINWRVVTEQQLKDWGARYHELHFGKPMYDLHIDDKSKHSDDFFKAEGI
jgi:hypothetical protein